MSQPQAPGAYEYQTHPPQASEPPEPRTDNHVVRNILLVLGVLTILSVGGCFALVGAAVHGIDRAVEQSAAEDELPGGRDNPITVEVGEAFEIGGMQFQAGWRTRDDTSNHSTALTELRVRNDRDDRDADHILVEVNWWRAEEVVARAKCSTDDIAFGRVATATCTPTLSLPGRFDTITVNDTF